MNLKGKQIFSDFPEDINTNSRKVLIREVHKKFLKSTDLTECDISEVDCLIEVDIN